MLGPPVFRIPDTLPDRPTFLGRAPPNSLSCEWVLFRGSLGVLDWLETQASPGQIFRLETTPAEGSSFLVVRPPEVSYIAVFSTLEVRLVAQLACPRSGVFPSPHDPCLSIPHNIGFGGWGSGTIGRPRVRLIRPFCKRRCLSRAPDHKAWTLWVGSDVSRSRSECL